jgi:hypothetical protein
VGGLDGGEKGGGGRGGGGPGMFVVLACVFSIKTCSEMVCRQCITGQMDALRDSCFILVQN